MSSPHRIVQPDGMQPGRGFAHAVVAEPGRTVWVAGEIATDADGALVGVDFVTQFDQALGNVVAVLEAAGAAPDHVVAMQIFVPSIEAYRGAAPSLAPVYQRHMGRHYPAMAVLGVTELVDEGALVEIMATAVVPAG